MLREMTKKDLTTTETRKKTKMDKVTVRILNKSAFGLPEYATEGSSGCDLRANISESIVIKPLERIAVPTGLFIELPLGYEAQIRSRSGLTLKHGIVVANGIGTIDSDYRGEICVILVNISNEDYEILPHEKIAQMVVVKYERAEFELCETLEDTQRGSGGFGHSGKL